MLNPSDVPLLLVLLPLVLVELLSPPRFCDIRKVRDGEFKPWPIIAVVVVMRIPLLLVLVVVVLLPLLLLLTPKKFSKPPAARISAGMFRPLDSG